ncbi:dTDP-4-dehydrorhamnose reductase [Neobacillus drentensis]|uniref:dTDP-4-dehydrorhamnose reductase n=1 Tax=Neobacillus drentensis TaxID=220684 RepID=UPI001F483FD8|nr:dTDP-4-dehydrorhamnose reductase [Neobacillus drentensis]ULT56450.1 dTDP-4-dehydrorhamnose reductase [Neobacillus drentensis]
MKVVVTGVKGQLGYDLEKQLTARNHEVFGLDRSQLDITDEQAVKAYMESVKPDAILHCAAYTNVDAAEQDKETAYNVNALGAKYLAEAASKAGAKMVYVSTDYVFDGTASEPYEVDHPTHPLGVYGETKFAGEEFVKRSLDRYFIVRTAWVFGINGNNFVKTMLRLAEERDELGVVHDQVGSPTYTVDLARFMIDLVESDQYGIYHATNEGVCSWYEFAVEIFNQAGVNVKVNPLTSEQFPRPAARPKYSVLSKKKITDQGFTPLPNWKEALSAFLREIKG